MIMEWFDGSITEAITEAKRRSALFVVVIHGPSDDEKTSEFLGRLDDVSSKFISYRSVCIKVENGSATCNQFSQIYPVFLVPSVYYINSLTGVNLEATGGDDVSQAKLEACLEKAMKSIQKSDLDPASVASPRAVRVEEAQKVLQDAAGSSSTSADANESAASSSASLEERVARAKELLAARRAQKDADEEEKEKNKEVERREMGKQMQAMKRKQEEDAIRAAAEERRKDKEETRIAREKIKAQIEQDRLERAEKFNQDKERREQEQKEKEKEALQEAARLADQELRERSSIARIQFRLPDGGSKTKQFLPEDQLAELYKYVETEMKLGFSKFSLSTTFPSRQLDREDRTANLRTLGLVPSATVLVLPSTGSSSSSALSSQDGGIMAFVWLVLTPITALFNFLSSMLFPAQPTVPTNSGNANPSSTRNLGAIRRDGNMARLRNTDDDDENNTYNGNSTQQM